MRNGAAVPPETHLRGRPAKALPSSIRGTPARHRSSGWFSFEAAVDRGSSSATETPGFVEQQWSRPALPLGKDRWRWDPRWRTLMRRLDHSTIHIFIAASTTPLAVLVLSGRFQTFVLVCSWVGALGGITLSVACIDVPRALA
jgi:hypothetical protein